MRTSSLLMWAWFVSTLCPAETSTPTTIDVVARFQRGQILIDSPAKFEINWSERRQGMKDRVEIQVILHYAKDDAPVKAIFWVEQNQIEAAIRRAKDLSGRASLALMDGTWISVAKGKLSVVLQKDGAPRIFLPLILSCLSPSRESLDLAVPMQYLLEVDLPNIADTVFPMKTGLGNLPSNPADQRFFLGFGTRSPIPVLVLGFEVEKDGTAIANVVERRYVENGDGSSVAIYRVPFSLLQFSSEDRFAELYGASLQNNPKDVARWLSSFQRLRLDIGKSNRYQMLREKLSLAGPCAGVMSSHSINR